MHNVAVIGCGYWGPNLIRNFQNIKECCVKTVCDKNLERLKYIKSIHNDIEVCIDYDEVLRDDTIGSIIIATPVRFHYQMGIKALNYGKNVFIEKPLATSVLECQDLIEKAENENLVLVVGHTFIYSQAVIKIKEIIS